jgi:uncharacterized protein YbjT (DUF2867 family)
MQILLLGCSGFVGRELVPLLLKEGHSLTLISRSGQPLAGLQHPNLQRIAADPSQLALSLIHI